MDQFEDEIPLKEIWTSYKGSIGPLRAATETKNLHVLIKILDHFGHTLLRSKTEKKEADRPDVTKLIREAIKAHNDDAIQEILSRTQNLKDADIYQFFDAALYKGLDQRAIEFLGHRDCDVAKPDANGHRVAFYLNTAARYGRLAVVQFLMSEKVAHADTDNFTNGWHALMGAAVGDQLETGRFLIQTKKCGRLDEQKKGTPAQAAYSRGHIDFLDLMFLQIPPESEDDDQGWVVATKLLKASREGDLQTVQNIISQPDAPINPFQGGPTPLHLAVKNHHAAIVKAILQTGIADVDRRFKSSNAVSEAALQHDDTLFRKLLDRSKLDFINKRQIWGGPRHRVQVTFREFCTLYGTAEILEVLIERMKASESISVLKNSYTYAPGST